MPTQRRRILVVEDEMLVAMALESLVAGMGYEVVGPVNSVARALAKATTEALHGAVLDVQLGREHVYPVADTLQRRQVPYLFLTGHDTASFPEHLRAAPRLTKPFTGTAVVEALAHLVRPR